MKALVFDNIEELNRYLKTKKKGTVEVQFHTSVVAQRIGASGEKVWEIVDRFLCIEQ